MNADATLPERNSTSWVRIGVTVFGIFFVFWLLFPAVIPGHREKGRSAVQQDVIVIGLALKHYIIEFDAPPAGDHAQIMAALRGNNPRQILFIDFDAKRFNARGEFLDRWGHPYRIETSNPKALRVYSFGENGIDEGGALNSDDIASWR